MFIPFTLCFHLSYPWPIRTSHLLTSRLKQVLVKIIKILQTDHYLFLQTSNKMRIMYKD